MATRNTSRAYWRHKGSDSATPAVAVQSLKCTFDPTAASAAVGVTLPSGAIPLGVDCLSGSTGGTNPTVDFGTSGDADGFGNEVASDAVSLGNTGALTGVALTADTAVYAGVGASAATGGTVTAVIHYIMSDDGSY